MIYLLKVQKFNYFLIVYTSVKKQIYMYLYVKKPIYTQFSRILVAFPISVIYL